jgi:hypothetical protein
MLSIGPYYVFGTRAGALTAGRCRSRITSDIVLPHLPAKDGALTAYSVRPSDCVSARLPITSENCPFVNFLIRQRCFSSSNSGVRFDEI